MDPLTAHRRALEVFADVVGNVKPDQIHDPTPCSEWDVRTVIEHVCAGNLRVAGRPPQELGDVAHAVADSAEAAHSAFAAPDGLTRIMDMPFGKVPGGVFIGIRTLDTLVHAWDVAKATAQSTDLDPELADAMLAVANERMTPDRRGAGKPFAEEQECPPGRPAADRLAAFMGRRVD